MYHFGDLLVKCVDVLSKYNNQNQHSFRPCVVQYPKQDRLPRKIFKQ
jgi:hypothetical protein